MRYPSTLFQNQRPPQNDSSYTCAAANEIASADWEPSIPNEEILQRFAEQIAEHPEIERQTCFICHTDDAESVDIAIQLGNDLENAGIETRLDLKNKNIERAQYLHDLTLRKKCNNALLISTADFLQQWEQYAKGEKNQHQKNNSLAMKQLRYVLKINKTGARIFEIGSCGDKLAQLLKIQLNGSIDPSQYPKHLISLPVIRIMLGLAQQGRLFQLLKEAYNTASDGLEKRPHPSLEVFNTQAAHLKLNR